MRDVSVAFQHHHRLGNETNDTGQEQRNTLESIYQPKRPRFYDDLSLLSHTHSPIQEKTNRLHIHSKQVGLKINKRKTEVMTLILNVQDPAPVKVEEDPLPYIEQFTYLGSTARHDGGAGSDISNRIGKARNASWMHSPVWKSQQYKTHTKLKLYKKNILSTLLCGSECWRITEKDLSKL